MSEDSRECNAGAVPATVPASLSLCSLAGQSIHPQELFTPFILWVGDPKDLLIKVSFLSRQVTLCLPPEAGECPLLPEAMVHFGENVEIHRNTSYNRWEDCLGGVMEEKEQTGIKEKHSPKICGANG